MSLFLGPIHHWMYQKIERRHRRINALVGALHEKHGAELVEETGIPKEGLGDLNHGRPLEELVHGFGIHDFLQQQINSVEQTEAKLLAGACQNGNSESVMETLCEAAAEFGRAEGRAAQESLAPEDAEQIDKLIDTLHLEAMPCSPVAEGEMREDRFVYRHVQCPHLANWKAGGADTKAMCRVERAWLSGVAEVIGAKMETGSSIAEGAEICEDHFIIG